jgi:hypothetical protein
MMQNARFQTPNSKQARRLNYQMTQTISFGILMIEIYLGFGAWNLVLHATLIALLFALCGTF